MDVKQNTIIDDRDVKKITDSFVFSGKYTLTSGVLVLSNVRFSSDSKAVVTPTSVDGITSVDGDFIPYVMVANCSAGTCTIASSSSSDNRTFSIIVIY